MVERALSCGPFWGWFLGIGVGGLMLGSAIWAWRRAQQYWVSARNIDQQLAAPRTLTEGPIVLRGVVRSEKPIALMLRIWQRHQDIKGRYPHRLYTEYKRQLTAEPFELELNTVSGLVRIPVEAQSDSLVEVQVPLREEASPVVGRVQTAAVIQGAEVTVSGLLRSVQNRNAPGEGYRDVGQTWVLSLNGGAISADLSAPHFLWFRFYRNYSLVAMALFLALQTTLLFNFYDMVLWGRVINGTVEQLDIVQNRTAKGGLEIHYFVSATLRPSGDSGPTFTVRDRITAIDHARLHPGDAIPFLFHWQPFHRVQVGPRPTLHVVLVLMFSVGWLLAMMFWPQIKRSKQPWWEAQVLVERKPIPR